MHSQRLRDTPLKPWLIADKHGKILCGHCDCVAGIGETCTHVAALLFYVETKVRIRDSRTVTQEAAYWKLPTSRTNVVYSRVCDMDFTSSKSNKRKLDALVNSDVTSLDTLDKTPAKKTNRVTPKPTNQDIDSLFRNLASSGSSAAILSVIPGYSKSFIPAVLSSQYPPVLTDLYDPENARLPFHELMQVCQKTEIKVSREQCMCVEQSTRKQSASKLWHRFRSGRITASKMKRVCRSNPDQPSQSLIKEICYPATVMFNSAATNWGCSHEQVARDTYSNIMQQTHENFQIKTSGLVIHPDFPFMGASPDALISCDCCGTGLVEIKCPFCARDTSVAEYCDSDLRTCLTRDPNVTDSSNIKLRRDHEYMYQIQTQLHVCDVDFVDFVVWTKNDIHSERIESDIDMWQEICEQSVEFFKKAVLPELLGKFYSKVIAEKTVFSQTYNNNNLSNEIKYCYCKEPEYKDDMIACDNENCLITWFHIGCLKIKKIPKGKFYCPDCRKLNRRRGNKKL